MSGDGRHRLDTRVVGPKKDARLVFDVRGKKGGVRTMVEKPLSETFVRSTRRSLGAVRQALNARSMAVRLKMRPPGDSRS